MKFFKFMPIALVSLAVVLVPVMPVRAAGSASLTVTANGSATTGSTIGVNIYENGDNVNVVTADLSYDAGQLQFINVDSSSSGFASQANVSGGGGGVSVSRYASDSNGNPIALSGTQLVATARFKVLGSAGSTAVSTASSSQIASNGANVWNGQLSSVSVGLVAPAPAAAPTRVATPVRTSTPAPVAVEETAAPVAEPTPAPAKAAAPAKVRLATPVAKSTDLTPFVTFSLLALAVIVAGAVISLRRRRTVASTPTPVVAPALAASARKSKSKSKKS